MILSIDPGNEESAYCFVDKKTMKSEQFGKVKNEEMLKIIKETDCESIDLVIEMIASYGMAVGKTVFDTCVWIGRFIEAHGYDSSYIYRKDVKMNLCYSMKAKDSNIRQALIDRFGIVGVKKSPGWFYGFKSDIWSAYAVAITYLDNLKKVER